MEKKETIEVFAIAFMFVLTVILTAIWFTAYLNGGQVTVTINEFGEKHPELVMWTFVVPIISVGLHHWVKKTSY